MPTKYGHWQLKVDVEYKNTHFRSLEGPVMLLWVILEYKPAVEGAEVGDFHDPENQD